jgi:multiple sugar transport system permease protein
MSAGSLALRPREPGGALTDVLWRPGMRHVFGYLLLLPAVFLTLFIIVYPIAIAFDLSFRRVRLMNSAAASTLPLTFANYERLAASPDFWNACIVSLLFVTIVTAACFVIGLGIALLVNQRFRGQKAARLIVALPWAVPEVVAAVTWAWIFDGSFGVVNWTLREVGLVSEQIAWLSQPNTAFTVVTVVMVWTTYPFVAIMLLAGLQAIPRELYEAARVDGASAWQRLRFVTLPCLRPVVGIALVLVILKIFREFTTIFVMTAGGPVGATRSLAVLTYEQAFSFYNIGYAAAIGVVTLLFCCAVSTAIVRKSFADKTADKPA